MDEAKYIGYLKYSGELVEEGFLDARKSAQALLGLDEAVRFFVAQQVPRLGYADFEFPVKIRQGSWEALIPETIGQWVTAGLSVAATAYLATAAKKMAEKDFDNTGMKDVFSNALKAMQWVLRIGKHLGNITHRKFEKVKWRNDNREIGISNAEGEYLFIPKDYLDLFPQSSPRILAKIAELVEEERVLVIGVYETGLSVEEVLPKIFRHIFTQEENDIEGILFPELVHGEPVALEGIVTRGNASSNTIGFKYEEHILTCEPATGSIVRFKPNLFLRAKIHGTISRMDEKGRIAAKKPRIIFTQIESLGSGPDSLSIFEDS